MSNNRVKVRNSLFFAVCRGESDKVEELISRYGISYSHDFYGGYALLSNAALFGYKKVVRFLLEKGAKVNRRIDHADTPLHFAAWFGDSELVKLLLDRAALIDAKDGQHETPLHIACQRGYENIVELLLDRGANPNAVRELPAIYEEKFAHVKIDQAAYNAACLLGHKGFKELLDYGVQLDGPNDHESLLSSESGSVVWNTEEDGNVTPLHLAAEIGCVKIVERLLNKGARIDAATTRFLTPLHLAVMHGHTDVAIALLKHGADVNKKDDNKRSPLYYALETKSLQLVSYVLQHKPEFDSSINELVFDIITHDTDLRREIIDDIIEHGFVPSDEDVNSSNLLQAAVQKGYTKMVKCLLDYGVKLADATKVNPTLLHLAVESGEKEMIALFLASGCDVNAKDEFGETPISYSMNGDQEGQCVEIIQLLLDHGADLKLAPDLLRKAVSQQNIDACNILIENGADVNMLDKNGKTPLHRAVPIKYGFSNQCKPKFENETAKLLLSADWTSKAEVCFARANLGIPCRTESIVQTLLDHGADVNSRTDDDSTALHLACQRGYQEIVELLLKSGANVEALQVNGLTPLHVAAQNGHTDIVETLLEFNADIDARGTLKETALHYAVRGTYSDVVMMLVKNGCDINIENSKGVTALGLAIAESPSGNFVHRAGLSKRRAVIIEALKKHAIKLKVAGFRISEKDLGLLSNSPSSQLYQIKCELEIGRIKQEKLRDDYNLFDVLEKRRYSRLMRNKLLVETLEAFGYEDFPIYETLLINSFNNSKKNLALLTSGGESLNAILRISNVVNVRKLAVPPPDVSEEIVSNLGNRDVKNLIHFVGNLKRQVSK